MKRAVPSVLAFCVIAGLVLARWADGATPQVYLVRPLLASAVIGSIVGILSLAAGRFAAACAVALAAGLATASMWVVLGVCALALIVLVGRIADRTIDPTQAITAGAVVFLLAGLARSVPLMEWPMATAEAATPSGATPVLLILLDGYPRADTLSNLGVDIGAFLDDLSDRGFTYHPNAHTSHAWTHHTLTAILGGTPTGDSFGTSAERRAIRERWRLPTNFAYIAPPAGHVTIPNARSIGPGGVNDFEVELVRRSLLGKTDWVGDLMMDGLRRRLEGSLDTLAATDERQVFAHLLAPHTPFLYEESGEPTSAPDCWPGCEPFDIVVERLGLTVTEWAVGIANYLTYLNERILEVVDAAIDRHPDAIIVLFSDHGGRYTLSEPDEWNHSFLATRGVELTEPTPAALNRLFISKR